MLSNQDLLKCRNCKINKGELIYCSIKSIKSKKTRLYLMCNECNTKRLKMYRDRNKEKIKNIVKKYDERNTEKRLAWARVAYALKTKRIIKPKECDLCEQEKRLDAHHEDYTKPLEVKWVCRLCHNKAHKNMLLFSYNKARDGV